MQLQFAKSAIRCLGTALQDVHTAEVTQELRLPDGMPDIGRILTTWGQIQLRSKEWQGSTVVISGGVMTWTLYAPEDGTEPRSVENWIPFQMKWELPQSDREGPLRVLPLLRFADSRSLSSRKMMVRSGVAAHVHGMYPMEAEIPSATEVPEDVQALKKTYPLRLPVECGEKTFLMDEETNVVDGASGEEKLLALTVTPEISEKKVLTSRLVFKGMLNVHLVYRDGDGRVHSRNLPLAFSQLTELDRNHSQEAQADIRMAVTSLEADLDQGKLRLKCGLVAQYLLDDRQILELIEDAYSPWRQVRTEESSVTLPVILEDRSQTLTAEQTVMGQHGQSADAVFLPDFPRVRHTGDDVEMEFPGMFQGLVYDENDALQGIGSRWEGKLTLPAHVDSRIQTDVSAGDVQAMNAAEGLIYSTPLSVSMRIGSEQEFPVVTGLELGELQEPDPARPSLILRNAAGESLWDLAKNSGSTVAAISAANGLAGEPAADQMLLIPVV